MQWRRSRLRYSGFLPLVVFVTVKCLISQTPATQKLSLTYSHGILHAAIPYQLPRADRGKLIVEVLDPEGHAIGRVEGPAEAGIRGVWTEDVALETSLPVDELVWHRLHYRFSYRGSMRPAVEEIESISQVLRRPVLRVIGQSKYLAGGAAASRLIVTDAQNEPVETPGRVGIEIVSPNGDARQLFAGPLNGRGTAQAEFRMPAGLVGRYQLRYTVDIPIGSAELTQEVQLEDAVSTMLTTERPVYQPGQTIHMRALELDRANHHARPDRPLTFELSQRLGKRVFSRSTRTDVFGIASAEFTLPNDANPGDYYVRANDASLTIEVEPRGQPQFKVTIAFDQGAKARHGYRPGEHVTGAVHAQEFSGRPVDRGEVAIQALGMDVAGVAGSSTGMLDGAGAFRFDLNIPADPRTRSPHRAPVHLVVEATVRDAAGRVASYDAPIVVSESPILIIAIPEDGLVVPHVENRVHILTSYADGKPAQTELTIRAPFFAGQRDETDPNGVAIAALGDASAVSLVIEARDGDGNRVEAIPVLGIRHGNQQILLRADRAIYRAGDQMTLEVVSTEQSGAAYIDIALDGQTILTRDFDLVNGHGIATLRVTPEMAGTLDCNAYLVGRDGHPLADHRLVFVQPAENLRIEAKADRPAYKPGENAQVRFRVTNSRGEGVQAALSVQIVDEALLALPNNQAAFAESFFYRDPRVMKARYEIPALALPQVLAAVERRADNQRAARALLAALELPPDNTVDHDVGRSIPWSEYYKTYRARYSASFEKRVRSLCALLSAPGVLRTNTDDLQKVLDRLSQDGHREARDAWGTEIRAQSVQGNGGVFYQLRSLGPDKLLNTDPCGDGLGNDLASYIEVGNEVRALHDGRVIHRTQVFHAPPGHIRTYGAACDPPFGFERIPLGRPREPPSGFSARVRSHFPEALYINPEIVTDSSGSATVSIPLTDSAKTWHLWVFASTADGAMGTGTSALTVF